MHCTRSFHASTARVSAHPHRMARTSAHARVSNCCDLGSEAGHPSRKCTASGAAAWRAFMALPQSCRSRTAHPRAAGSQRRRRCRKRQEKHLAHILTHTGHAWTDTTRKTHRMCTRATTSRRAPLPAHPTRKTRKRRPPLLEKLDARTQRRDSRAAAQAPRRGPDGAAPSPPPSVLTDQRFRPGPMQSTADSSLDLLTLTRGRRGGPQTLGWCRGAGTAASSFFHRGMYGIA